MELMYAKQNMETGKTEVGLLRNYDADFEIGVDENSFTIKKPLRTEKELLYIENRISTVVYVEGTEFGGKITGSTLDIGGGTVEYTGKTWRGMLEQFIIEPPKGEDYRIVSAGANLKDVIDSLPHPPEIVYQPCGYTLPRQFQFDRYIKTSEGVTKLMADVDSTLHLRISYDLEPQAALGKCTTYIEPRRDLRDKINFSQDYSNNIDLMITHDGSTPKRLICLGKGDLKDREVLNLYADANWNITLQEIAGAFPVEIYDYSSTENLEADGMKHYQEIINAHEKIEVNINNMDIKLDDLVGARDNITGESVEAEITGIVWKRTDYGDYVTETWEYKTKARY